MIAGRFRLPDVDGVIVEEVLEFMAERMRPAKGQPWDTLEHRKADALVELCTRYASVEPRRRRKPLVVVHVPEQAVDDDAAPGATVAGIPIANETARAVMAHASVIRQQPLGATARLTRRADTGPSP
jgi:hypothetical protein